MSQIRPPPSIQLPNKPYSPSDQILRRKRTKGAQQNIIRCAPFSIALPVAITTEVTTAFI